MYAVVDIETTGTSARLGRITEIAIFIFDGHQVVDSFTSLVNPECPIPYFISRLTGITDQMVANAPRFCEIARRVVEITEGRIFVAHNAAFDYGFIREEYARLGYEFRRDKLCTVTFSRRLMPGLRSYALGNLCASLGIDNHSRHRAGGDAWATVQLLERLLRIKEAQNLQGISLADTAQHPLVKDLPETTGVYYLINEQKEVIYIGKSLNIRDRVNTHLSRCKTSRTIRMMNDTAAVSYEVTCSSDLALLLESAEIKTHMPFFNRRQRRKIAHYGLFSLTDGLGYQQLRIDKTTHAGPPLVAYESLSEARQHLYTLAERYELCQKLCGLYSTSGACFQHSIRQCRGACIGLEPASSYNGRVGRMLDQLSFSKENYFIIEPGRHRDEKAVIKVEGGKYIGFGYIDPSTLNDSPHALHDAIKSYEDNRDVQQIIATYLRQRRPEKVISF